MSNVDPSPRADRPQDSTQAREPSEPSFLSQLNDVVWRNRELNVTYAPDSVPDTIQNPKYAIGDRCRWIPTNATDWGTIIGQVIAPVESVQSTTSQWVWLYLVLLDLDSPSRQWVATDWAEEGDLERFHPPA